MATATEAATENGNSKVDSRWTFCFLSCLCNSNESLQEKDTGSNWGSSWRRMKMRGLFRVIHFICNLNPNLVCETLVAWQLASDRSRVEAIALHWKPALLTVFSMKWKWKWKWKMKWKWKFTTATAAAKSATIWKHTQIHTCVCMWLYAPSVSFGSKQKKSL